ncbi:MAG: hypothetical protein K2P35_15515 [Lachnospiraceae bacterium]|nr:hypothetical protein [Lachnospiraceae bacterium]
MFNYVIMVGSGAITYLLAQKGTDIKNRMWYKEIIEYFMYVMLDMLTVYFCMAPLGRITRVDNMTSGVTQIQYGNTAILFSIAVSVVMGIVFLVIKKKADISAEIKRK